MNRLDPRVVEQGRDDKEVVGDDGEAATGAKKWDNGLAGGAGVEEDDHVVLDQPGGKLGDRTLPCQLEASAGSTLARRLGACPLAEANATLNGDDLTALLEGGDVASNRHVRDAEGIDDVTDAEHARTAQESQDLLVSLFGDEGHEAEFNCFHALL